MTRAPHALAGAYKANGQIDNAVKLLEYVVKVEEKLVEDTQFKVIPSLNRVIVRIADETPTSSRIELMRGFGWVVLRSHGEQC